MITGLWLFLKGVNPRVWLAIALCAATLYGLDELKEYYVAEGRGEVQAKWDNEKTERKAAENTAILARVKDNEQIAKHQTEINESIQKDHTNEIAKIHAGYATANRLRIPAAVCNQLAASADTQSPSGGDAAIAGAVALPESLERDLRELMQEADTMLAGCRSAQKFIIDNGFSP